MEVVDTSFLRSLTRNRISQTVSKTNKENRLRVFSVVVRKQVSHFVLDIFLFFQLVM